MLEIKYLNDQLNMLHSSFLLGVVIGHTCVVDVIIDLDTVTLTLDILMSDQWVLTAR